MKENAPPTLKAPPIFCVATAMLLSTLFSASGEGESIAGREPDTKTSGVCIAELRPPGAIDSSASGSATLRIAADNKSAVLTYQQSNLSSAETAVHIDSSGKASEHTQGPTILFDVAAARPQPDGSYVWTFNDNESSNVEEIVASIKAGQTILNIETEKYPAGELSGIFRLARAAQNSAAPTPAPPVDSGKLSPGGAARLLAQTTFGPTDDLIAHVEEVGTDAYLREQLQLPASSHLKLADASTEPGKPMRIMLSSVWTLAVTAPDQLRQRIAFALSEIFVVSVKTDALNTRPFAIANYLDVLANDAFANYRQLLQDVTLNPAMGAYLNMLHNGKGDPTKGTHPNENYAREVLQLFSIGLYRLNLDGTLKVDANGSPIPAYDQRAVLGLAAAFTGWNFAHGGPARWKGVPMDFRRPMRSVPEFHDTSAKTILDGVRLPPNQTAEQDLKQALDAIFNHPNVGPFVSRQLIQRLVTSNPSPAYVYRVASVFNDNGRGVRGDMAAVIRAIITDYEARSKPDNPEATGHVREPVLRLTALLRAFRASTPSGVFVLMNPFPLGQVPMHSPTVFNFFSPDYQVPGAIAEKGLTTPEFQITTESTAISTANFLQRAIFEKLGPAENKISLDFRNEEQLAAEPEKLVDHLNLLLMSNSMSAEMRNVLISAIAKIPANERSARARTAIYLITNSPEYAVEK